MADAIFDSSGAVAGNGGVNAKAWSGSGSALANLLGATAGSLVPSGLLDGPGAMADYVAKMSNGSLPHYSYPTANQIDYSKIAQDALDRANALKQQRADEAARAGAEKAAAYKQDNIVNLLSNPDPAAQEIAYQKLIAQRNSPGPGVASYSPVVSEPRQKALESMGLPGVSRNGEGALPTSGQRPIVDDFARTRYSALKDMGLVM